MSQSRGPSYVLEYAAGRVVPLGEDHTKEEWKEFEDWLKSRSEYRDSVQVKIFPDSPEEEDSEEIDIHVLPRKQPQRSDSGSDQCASDRKRSHKKHHKHHKRQRRDSKSPSQQVDEVLASHDGTLPDHQSDSSSSDSSLDINELTNTAQAESRMAFAAKIRDEANGQFIPSDSPSKSKPPPLRPNAYGGQLRPGEGEAMAQFVQSGKRIPRRGEVGFTAEEIELYEELGYVMSGSRHRRMNAVRIRKETQIYSAEEQRALAMYVIDERATKEQQLIADLQELLSK